VSYSVNNLFHPLTRKYEGNGFLKFSSENDAAAALKKMGDEVIYGL
jgi:hypothetical protein